MHKVLLISCLLAFFTSSGSPAHGAPTDTKSHTATESSKLQFNFNGKEYFHRWSKANQNEFTPEGQTDLEKWQDMVTINVVPNTNTGEKLSDFANRVLSNYQAHGKIIRTDSKPKTATSLAEHLAVCILGDPKFVEVVFARFVIVDGNALAIIYSHRVYGEKVGTEAGKFLRENGTTVENFLMAWDKMPQAEKLLSLPQSK